MPIYEFKCLDCNDEFEKLVFSSRDIISCPKCEGNNLERLMSACRVGGRSNSDSSASTGSSGCSSCGGGSCASCH